MATERKAVAPDPGVVQGMWRSAQLVWRLMLDSRVPAFPKLIVPMVMLYVVSPIDVLPELPLLLLGTVDDLALVFFGLKLFISLCPPDVVMEHRHALEGGAPARSRPDVMDGTYRVVDDD
jgi:uncharacterized membrane protein YkvA (DUF1232 family)